MTTPSHSSDAGLPELVQQNPAVHMFTAPNAGPKTLNGTNTYTVGTDCVLLIDPGPDEPTHIDRLSHWLQDQGAKLQGIFLTHLHPDHAPAAQALAAQFKTSIFTLAGDDLQGDDGAVKTVPLEPNRRQWGIAGDILSVVPSPGHTPDHVCFFLERSRVLFTGDAVLGRGSTLIAPPEGDVRVFMQTLQALRTLQPLVLAPGHGPIVRDAVDKIDADLRHREERERAILVQLADGSATSEQLVKQIYRDTHPELLGLAHLSVQAQLQKLANEGRIKQDRNVFSLRKPQSL